MDYSLNLNFNGVVVRNTASLLISLDPTNIESFCLLQA